MRFSFCRESFSFCREVFSFCREVFLLAVSLFFLPWGFSFCRVVFLSAVRFCFCREVNSFAVTVVGHRTKWTTSLKKEISTVLGSIRGTKWPPNLFCPQTGSHTDVAHTVWKQNRPKPKQNYLISLLKKKVRLGRLIVTNLGKYLLFLSGFYWACFHTSRLISRQGNKMSSDKKTIQFKSFFIVYAISRSKRWCLPILWHSSITARRRKHRR